MNRMPLLFIGIFATFISAWIGLVAYPKVALGNLQQIMDPDTQTMVPPTLSGSAIAGQRVYASAGCVYCHSQQVRQPYITTSDLARGWGSRPTVARDYIFEQPVFLGTMRTGPDLANVGRRWPDPMWHHRHLYEPAEVSPGSIMPAYRYLYRMQQIVGQPSADAVTGLVGPYAPPEGYEVVPTEEARAVVAYLLSLDKSYPLPEAPEPELP
jgi:cytochrome c oxidase cbb3-type subunit 2